MAKQTQTTVKTIAPVAVKTLADIKAEQAALAKQRADLKAQMDAAKTAAKEAEAKAAVEEQKAREAKREEVRDVAKANVKTWVAMKPAVEGYLEALQTAYDGLGQLLGTYKAIRKTHIGGTRVRKDGLRTNQVRLLKFIQDNPGKSRTEIAMETSNVPGKPRAINDSLGVIGDTREAAEAKAGFPSLLTLGYVLRNNVEIEEGVKSWTYTITPAGKKALAEVEKASTNGDE